MRFWLRTVALYWVVLRIINWMLGGALYVVVLKGLSVNV